MFRHLSLISLRSVRHVRSVSCHFTRTLPPKRLKISGFAHQNNEKKGLITLIGEGTNAARQQRAETQAVEIFQAQVRFLYGT